MNITEICIKKPVLAWMIMGAAVVFGVVAASRIGISQMPDVDFPNITVEVTREGAAPEVMEHDVVEPLEEALVQVEGVRSLTSTSRQGSATVTVELDLDRKVDVALQDVQTKVSQAQRFLPRDLDPPIINKTNPEDQPIMWIAVSGPYSRQMVSDHARYRVKEKLQTVPGVGEIMLGGYLERNVRIWIDHKKLDEKNLTVTEVIAALQREHVELPAGRLEASGREINVRVLGEALELDDLRNIVVRSDEGGTPIYMHDVALVEDGFEDARRLGRVGGEPAQGLGIKKQRGANAVAVAKAVRSELDQIQKSLPENMKAEVMFDSSRFIEESVNEIEVELVLAVLLTALVCWMFLGSLSSTLNVVLAIPMSLLGTVAIIYFLGFTLNTFTLLALSLAVGIVVDDAIMVLENIYRHGEMGKDKVAAAREGTREITFAALAATLAVVAIFLPVAFMKGIVGKFFLQFGVTLSLAVMLSYLEAITLAPARCAQFLDTARHRRGRLGQWVDRAFDALNRAYHFVLIRGIRRPLLVLLGAGIVMVGAVLALRAIPGEFTPSQDQSRVLVRLQTAVGSSLEETNAVFTPAERYVNGRPDVERAFFVIGGFGGAVNTGIIFLTMVPREERSITQAEFAAQVRKELNAIPGVKAVVQDLSQAGFSAQRGFPVEFSVRGNDWDGLVAAADQVRRDLQQSGVVVDVDTDYQLGMPELRVTPNRARAADAGVSVDDLASSINALVGGTRIGKYSTGGRRIDVRARLLADQRSRPESLSLLQVRNKQGELLPLGPLVDQQEVPALQAVTRRDRERAITIFANVAQGHSQQEALAYVQELGKKMPEGTRLVLGGASLTFQESTSSLLFALLLGVLVAYMVLGAQFNSFLHPLTVLTILPLSLAGAAFALLITGLSLNIFSMIGLLLLMGIVKKNSIILVDYANQTRAETGCDAREAMVRAGPIRLRPILMTSVATMTAAIPAALGLGAGSEVRTPMAVAVLGGLSISTLLSLLVVPAFYVVADRFIAWVKRLFGRGRAPEPIPVEQSGSHPANVANEALRVLGGDHQRAASDRTK
ncbi:MAG TPA: efflux RND transporter permease subunit [Polyangiaceae bacterium]|nr:efflux RND transporter permease subunit [Polyangiaceae bacterium]